MSSDYISLKNKVDELDATLRKLISNLSDTNDIFLDALDAITRTDRNANEKRSAFKNCEGGICTINPPGCKRHHHEDGGNGGGQGGGGQGNG